MDEDFCDISGQWSCTTSTASKAAVTKVNSHKEAHKKGWPLIWEPLAPTSKACSCGCIYIVNARRSVDITSGENCHTLPITWTIKVCVWSAYFRHLHIHMCVYFYKQGLTYISTILFFQAGEWSKKASEHPPYVSRLQLRQFHIECAAEATT